MAGTQQEGQAGLKEHPRIYSRVCDELYISEQTQDLVLLSILLGLFSVLFILCLKKIGALFLDKKRAFRKDVLRYKGFALPVEGLVDGLCLLALGIGIPMLIVQILYSASSSSPEISLLLVKRMVDVFWATWYWALASYVLYSWRRLLSELPQNSPALRGFRSGMFGTQTLHRVSLSLFIFYVVAIGAGQGFVSWVQTESPIISYSGSLFIALLSLGVMLLSCYSLTAGRESFVYLDRFYFETGSVQGLLTLALTLRCLAHVVLLLGYTSDTKVLGLLDIYVGFLLYLMVVLVPMLIILLHTVPSKYTLGVGTAAGSGENDNIKAGKKGADERTPLAIGRPSVFPETENSDVDDAGSVDFVDDDDATQKDEEDKLPEPKRVSSRSKRLRAKLRKRTRFMRWGLWRIENLQRFTVAIIVLLALLLFLWGAHDACVSTIAAEKVGISLLISRGTAKVMVFVLPLLIVCLSPTLMTMAMRFFGPFLPFNRRVRIHLALAGIFVIAGVIHTAAHMWTLSRVAEDGWEILDLQDGYAYWVPCGVAGVGMLVCLAVLAVLGWRLSYSHFTKLMLHRVTAVVFMAFYLSHGVRWLLGPDEGAILAGASVIIYLIAEIYRDRTSLKTFLFDRREIFVNRFKKNESKTLIVRLYSPGTDSLQGYNRGDYCYLRYYVNDGLRGLIPVSRPFTIYDVGSGDAPQRFTTHGAFPRRPDCAYIEFHLVVHPGKAWTNELENLTYKRKRPRGGPPSAKHRVALKAVGPFSSPASLAFSLAQNLQVRQHFVLIATGIGITPMFAVFKHLITEAKGPVDVVLVWQQSNSSHVRLVHEDAMAMDSAMDGKSKRARFRIYYGEGRDPLEDDVETCHAKGKEALRGMCTDQGYERILDGRAGGQAATTTTATSGYVAYGAGDRGSVAYEDEYTEFEDDESELGSVKHRKPWTKARPGYFSHDCMKQLRRTLDYFRPPCYEGSQDQLSSSHVHLFLTTNVSEVTAAVNSAVMALNNTTDWVLVQHSEEF